MEIPVFNQEQLGTTLYYSPLNIYNLRVVDQAYFGNSDYNNPKEHMHAHVYHEGVMLFTNHKNIENQWHDSSWQMWCWVDKSFLQLFCSKQKQNCPMLLPYLVEMGYFKEVYFVFLIVGHTKNAADSLTPSKRLLTEEDLQHAGPVWCLIDFWKYNCVYSQWVRF